LTPQATNFQRRPRLQNRGFCHSRRRSLAPDLVRGDLGTAWIYVVGPILGALIGVAFEWILKGKPTTADTFDTGLHRRR